MGFAAGLQAGVGASMGFLKNMESTSKMRKEREQEEVRRKIGDALAKDRSFSEEKEEWVPAQPAVNPENASMVETKDSANPLRARGLVTPEQPSMVTAGEGQNASPVDVPQPQVQAGEWVKRVIKRPNPMGEFEGYEEAARIAAENGMLDLQKAYTDMGRASMSKGLYTMAGKAIADLDKGETGQLKELLNNPMVSQGVTYDNLSVDENGNVYGEARGADGKVQAFGLTRQQLYEQAMLAANPEFIGKMYDNYISDRQARATAEAEYAKELRGYANQLGLKEMELNAAMERTKVGEAGRWDRHLQNLGVKMDLMAQKDLESIDTYYNSLGIPEEQLLGFKRIGQSLKLAHPNKSNAEIASITEAIRAGNFELDEKGSAVIPGAYAVGKDGKRVPLKVSNMGTVNRFRMDDDEAYNNQLELDSIKMTKNLASGQRYKEIKNTLAADIKAGTPRNQAIAEAAVAIEGQFLGQYGMGSNVVAGYMANDMGKLIGEDVAKAERDAKAAASKAKAAALAADVQKRGLQGMGMPTRRDFTKGVGVLGTRPPSASGQ